MARYPRHESILGFFPPTGRIVFASDCPQEICKPEAVKKFVDDIRAIGPEGEAMLSGNVGLLLES